MLIAQPSLSYYIGDEANFSCNANVIYQENIYGLLSYAIVEVDVEFEIKEEEVIPDPTPTPKPIINPPKVVNTSAK